MLHLGQMRPVNSLACKSEQECKRYGYAGTVQVEHLSALFQQGEN